MLTRLFRPNTKRTVALLYGRIVTQARQPGFYRDCGVPDTFEGRFEMVSLHAWLVMRRLAKEGERAAAFNQALFDFMFAEMDSGLREIGVYDLSVGRKVKELASHYYGRVAAYDSGLAADAAPEALEDALDRNLFGSTLPERAAVRRVADYVRREAAALDSFPADRLLAGEVEFGPAPQAE